MKLEWNVQKARFVLEERGVDSRDAALALVEGVVLLTPSPRQNEELYVGLVEIQGKVWAVVHLCRGEALRIITVRRARPRAERAYRAFLARRAEGVAEQN